LRGTVCGKTEIRFETGDLAEIYRSGEVPLPPYIKRRAEESDRERYQTVYACRPGAVAAPTAGLHFTGEHLERLRSSGVRFGALTLHTGPGTFRPVKTENVEEHPMEAEQFEIPPETLDLLSATRAHNGRIVAVGTTTVRSLETYAATGSARGETALFIRPGHRFRLCDALLTNFHLPRTTLLMLVHAFCGSALARRAYEEAIAARYRFYSYGDAMLIL
jgi:S-adenosylmethionine:tRNA ribosyltransferase-isomerase